MEDAESDFQDLLFSTSTGLIDFVIIESDISQIADYGKALIGFSVEKLRQVEAEMDVGDDDERFHWEHNVGLVTPMILLVALYIVVEKSLKNLCYSFEKKSNFYEVPKGDRFKIAVQKNESNIDAQLRFLKQCGFKFELAAIEKETLDRGRKLRNDFAHGDWKNVEAKVSQISFETVLVTISNVFEKIEKGMPSI